MQNIMMCSVTTDCLWQSLKVAVLLYISVISGSWPLVMDLWIYKSRILNIWPAPPSHLRACRNDSALSVLFAPYYKDILTCRTGLWAISVRITGGSLCFMSPSVTAWSQRKPETARISRHAVLRVMTRQSVKLLQDICPFCNVSYLESCGRSQ